MNGKAWGVLLGAVQRVEDVKKIDEIRADVKTLLREVRGE